MRKIIHIDMDCFYAAIEIRDNPSLAHLPVAVGGPGNKRGVICTCNYIARKYGIHSAMPTANAYKRCKDLIILPVNMPKYKEVAIRIQNIFKTFTDQVEPLSLDEAYLDVSQTTHHQGSATRIAEDIRKIIWETEQLHASAGVAPNKFLAKIASGWRKPNGLFVIRPQEVASFIQTLPIHALFGVGKVTTEKMHQLDIHRVTDLQKFSLLELKNQFGKLGEHLYWQCRGIDHREVIAHRARKSLSVENTFENDMFNLDQCLGALQVLYEKLCRRVEEAQSMHLLKNQFIKIKLNNFRRLSAEVSSHTLDYVIYQKLFIDLYKKANMPIRLLGLGVHFVNDEHQGKWQQQSFL